MKTLENLMNRFFVPIAEWMNRNTFFSTLSETFIRTTPLILGIALLSIIGSFPVLPWLDFLKSIGLASHFKAVTTAVTEALSLYVVFLFAYTYTKKVNIGQPLTAGLLALGVFMFLMPQTMTVGILTDPMQIPAKFPAKVALNEIKDIVGFMTTYTGGTGLFLAIVIGFIVSVLFTRLTKSNVQLKLPSSVPSMVSESLSPAIISTIIFTLAFVVRVGFSFTPFGNIFAFFTTVIQAPLQGVTGAPFVLILIFTLANLLWFFGIHPNVIYGAVYPILFASTTANIEAFKNGDALPFLLVPILGLVCTNALGGTGNTYGLIISMATAKSARYKQLFKLAAVPSIFNINEPLIFGMPVILNPYFFIPMVFAPFFSGLAAWGLTRLLNFNMLNPLIGLLPWTTPGPVKAILAGGLLYFGIVLVCVLISIFLYFPFFKAADNKELADEQLAEKESAEQTA